MIHPMPLLLLRLAGQQEVQEWWDELTTGERKDLLDSYRAEPYPKNCLPYREPEEEPETEIEGVFVNDWYEYLVNHEMFAEPPRTFHICTSHPLARRVQVNGVLPFDFVCPLDHAAAQCPMRQILAQSLGKAFVLTGKAQS